MVKGLLLGRGPIPRQVFLSKIDERTSNGGIIGNKSAIEVGEP